MKRPTGSVPLVVCFSLWFAGCGPQSQLPAAGPKGANPQVGVDVSELARLGDGYAVWESNRSGEWRIWTRRLDGSGLRQLSPDDDHQHCCPHISPDGRRVVYLSRSISRDRDWYESWEVAGPLRWVDLDSGKERTLVPQARTYGWGNRCAVWRDDRRLIYVDRDGRTAELDLQAGNSRPLVAEAPDKLAWLMDPTLQFATTADPGFSPYDAAERRVLDRGSLGGCEPYFSQDGRWGYWVAGAGGPIHRIDLTSRQISILLRKNDPRMPGEQGYLYFPMLSRDGHLFAFGASADEHDHFRSNYDIYVARSDPRTLELIGKPLRLTSHQATDRYPDVFLAPLELGRHFGEAPLSLEFVPAGVHGELDWDYGDGSAERAEVGRHTFDEPGIYAVQADGGEQSLRAYVIVDEPRPPRIVEIDLEAEGRRLWVHFDEAVQLSEDRRASLASGLAIAGLELGPDGRSLIVDLEQRLEMNDRLSLDGVLDRAPAPNRMPPVEIDVAPPSWPDDRRDLVFVWQTGDQPNLVWDPEVGGDVSYQLEPRGRARLDRHYAMVLGGGAFAAPPETARALLAAVQTSNELTLEATLRTDELAQTGPAEIVSFAANRRRRNLILGQEGPVLVLNICPGPTKSDADCPRVALFELDADRPVHLALTYSPGILHVYRNGELVKTSRDIRGGFNRWKPGDLLFGHGTGGGADWSGRLEGIALYNRIHSPVEVRTNFIRYRALLDRRTPIERLEVQARLRAKSKIPTLDQISPYRKALAVYEYQVEDVLSGKVGEDVLRVAHWVILDGETLPIAAAQPGSRARLVLEPFDANPQLESHYLSETLEGRYGPGLFYDVRY